MNLSIILILALAGIRLSDGAGTCTCRCCAGIGCTSTEQGTITVESCGSSDCGELCRNRYPQQCVTTNGVSQILCSSSSTSAAQPNWFGSYTFDKKCDQNICCCPVGTLVLSNAGDDRMRVQCSFAGKLCPDNGLSVDEYFVTPTGSTTVIEFIGNLVNVRLVDNGTKIEFNNPRFPRCSESATRNQASSSSTINMGLLSSFVALMIIGQWSV